MTLRLVISVTTEIVCVDLDGPGHAPPYLCVRPLMNIATKVVISAIAVLVFFALGLYFHQCRALWSIYNSIDIEKTKLSQAYLFDGFRFVKGDEYDFYERRFDIGIMGVETYIVWASKRDRIVEKYYSISVIGRSVYAMPR